ncbi:hypothetical protein MBANPS3_012611 [Mucor bainieri]
MFGPNCDAGQGCCAPDPSVFDTMADTVQTSTDKFGHIRICVILEGTVGISALGTPDNVALLCTQTLEELQLSGGVDWDFIPRLREFSQLTSLILNLPDLDDFNSLDSILDSCQHLQNLVLTIGSWRDSSANDASGWDQQTASKHPHIKGLIILFFLDSSADVYSGVLAVQADQLENDLRQFLRTWKL